jgi:hypothetical protein
MRARLRSLRSAFRSSAAANDTAGGMVTSSMCLALDVNVLADSLRPSRELAVSRRVLLSFRTNHAAMLSAACLTNDPCLREAQFKLCVNHPSQSSGGTIPLP